MTNIGDHVWVGRRRYYHCGKGNYPGVTTILEATKRPEDAAGLARWRARVGEAEANRISSESAARGTQVHARIEAYLSPRLPQPQALEPLDHDPALDGYWNSIQSAIAEIKPLYLEQFVYSDRYRYAGTMDCLGYYQGKLSLIDFKTSAKVKPEAYTVDWLCQLVAYAAASREIGILPDSIELGVVLVALPDRPAQVFTKPREELREYWYQFQNRVNKFYLQLEAG